MDGRDAPAISVVIPTYEPGPFLIETVRGVLAQDLGPSQMQVAIVDDASQRVHPARLLAAIAPEGRIEYHEHTERLGLAGNWNRSIGLARGRYVHLLHQDDTVAVGFYAALLSGLRTSERIGMAFCRHAFIDEAGRVERISHRERWRPGVLPRWLERIGERQRLQCPAAMVRREVYETLGGFRTDLRYALDWEMWVRIAAAYEVWYEPRVLACYRRHHGAESARLESSGDTLADVLSAIDLMASHVPPRRRMRVSRRAYQRLLRGCIRRAAKLIDAGLADPAAREIGGARKALALLPESPVTRWRRSQLTRLELRLANRSARTGV